jgi:cell division septation protein DedD
MPTHSRRPSAIHALATLLVVAAAMSSAGCEGRGQRGLDRSIAAYDAGDYARAYDLADAAAGDARTTKDADEAAYLAGMSAYRLGRYQDAERWLTQAARSGDRWLAGQAGVTLGSTQLQLGRTAEAGRTFARAAEKLDDEEARRARLAAGNAFRDIGDTTRADEQFRLAGATAATTPRSVSEPVGASPSPRTATSPTTTPVAATGDFTLQGGAFRDEAKARARAEELRSRSVRAGLGEPRVLTKRAADGTLLFVVQMGAFRDRSAANTALSRLSADGVVVIRASA